VNKHIYAIRDRKIGELLNAVLLKNAAEAERFYLLVCSDQRSPVAAHPKDYEILELGGIDSETGVIVPGHPKDVTPHSAVDAIIRTQEANNHGAQGK